MNQGTLVKCQDLESREYSDYPVERLIKGTESEGNHNRLRLLPDYKMKRVTGNSFNWQKDQNTEYERNLNEGRHSTRRMGSREEKFGTRKIFGTVKAESRKSGDKRKTIWSSGW